MRRTLLKIICLLTLAPLVAGCGFKLRGEASLPFASAYVDAGDTVHTTLANKSTTSSRTGSLLAPQLRKYLESNHKLVGQRDKAAIVIRLSGEVREKTILSLSGTGKVREYRLTHRVSVSANDAQGHEVLVPSLIQINRDFTYSDEQILAKEAEEALLQKEMEQDILRQIIRRLGYAQPS
jgi:LPS-assembly lipoprotein